MTEVELLEAILAQVECIACLAEWLLFFLLVMFGCVLFRLAVLGKHSKDLC